MKTLKLNHDLAKLVLNGEKTNTWRIHDDKNLSVDDEVELIDKVEHDDPDTWVKIGVAKIDSIVEKRLAEITPQDNENHEVYGSLGVMIQTFKGYYGPDVDENTPVKMCQFTFTRYPKPRPLKESQMELVVQAPKVVKLFADGGSRGNPGPSASGYAILDMEDNIIIREGRYLGITTNNQAEYQALKFGLEHAHKLGIQEVNVFLDSLLVINQMKGIFKIKNRDLWPIHQAIKDMIPVFKKVTFTHVPRELNKIADEQVNVCLDAQ